MREVFITYSLMPSTMPGRSHLTSWKIGTAPLELAHASISARFYCSYVLPFIVEFSTSSIESSASR